MIREFPTMTAKLDSLLAALREHPLDPRLETLEPLVWSRIAAHRPETPNIWAWRMTLAAAIMSAGALTAGVAAAKAPQTSPFAIHSAYAPSTLLAGGS